MALSSFYKDGMIDSYVQNSDSVKFPCKMTRKLNELFAGGSDTFDTSCFIAANTNNKQLLTMTKVPANTAGNYDAFLENVTNIILAEGYEYSPEVNYIGTVLLAFHNSLSVPKGIYSARYDRITHTGYGNDTCYDARIVTDINGTGLNDIYVSYGITDLNETYAYNTFDNNTLIKDSGFAFFYCPDLKNRTSNSDVATHQYQILNVAPYFVIATEEDTLFLPYYYYFLHGGNYRGSSPKQFFFDWTQTGEKTPTVGYFSEGDTKYAFLPSRLSGETSNNILLGDENNASLAIINNTAGDDIYTRGLRYPHALWLFNTIGLKWVVAGDTDAYTDIRLPFMDADMIVDKAKFDKGLQAIKESKSANADLSYDKLPNFNPPHGGDSGDDIDDMALGYEGYENGFIKHYEVTAGNLETISQKLAEDTTHLNAINNIVSLKSYVIPTNQFIAAAVSDRIIISGVDTTVDAPKITVTKSDYEIGSTAVQGKYGNASEPHFLDFAPFTQIECYIPFCGVVQLPDWVMYKTIHVILISDIIAGSCKGIVKCDGNIVAEKVGVLGIDAPFTSEANALKNSAMLQTVLNGANIGMQTLSSGASGNYGGIAKNTLQGLANIQQSILAGNNNYTVSVGTAPDKIEYAMPSFCYIKVYFPVKEEPENYGHTVGKPLMKKKTLSEVSGFTVCSNVDTDGIAGATASERDKIKSLLETGIII